MACKVAIKISKGGTGKTTSAVNLASALATLHQRTLLVDLDPQANATASAGITNPTITLSALLSRPSQDVKQAIIKTEYGLDVLPTDSTLAQVEENMSSTKIGIMKELLSRLDSDYDYIIIDTPPADSFLVTSVLLATDKVLIPMETQFLPMYGLAQAIEDIESIKSMNPGIKIAGILPTKVEQQTILAQKVLNEVKNTYPDLLLDICIPKSVRVSEAPATGKPIIILDPTHPASLAYKQLAEYLMT